MDPEKIKQQTHNDSTLPEAPTPEIHKQSFLRKYRMYVIVCLMALAIGLFTLFVFHKRANTNNLATTNSPTKTQPKAAIQTESITNTWKTTIDLKALPLGDGKVATLPQTGNVYSCTSNFRGGGARHAGDWINDSAGTWDSEAKVVVNGNVDWPSANYTDTASGDHRIVTTDDLPKNDPTGIFPIARSDPAYQFDTNPNHIDSQTITLTLPLNPSAASSPSCVGLGYIGVLNNGVLLFNGLDDAGRDAVAHETQDSCNGHPDGQERYHYHNVASCIRSRSTASSTLVGYALDGYGIYVERDAKGNLPTNADLDECHGRTSQITWNGSQTTIYHYDATLEYPYTVGCYHGTPISHRP